MPFFLPRRLVELEYFSAEADPEYYKIANDYQGDIDFAFFAANFGYSKLDYEQLTYKDKAFLRKAWENKEVSNILNTYNAVFAAIYNANRTKRKRAIKPIRKKAVKKGNRENANSALNIAKEVERKEGKDWVTRIFKANGLKPPERS